MPRKRRNQQQSPPTAPMPSQPQPQSSELGRKSLLGRLNDHSHHFSNWAQFGGFWITLFALALSTCLQWGQIQDLKDGRSDADKATKVLEKQFQILQESNEKMRALEVIPLILAEARTDRIKLGTNLPADLNLLLKANQLSAVKQPSGMVRSPFVPDTDDFLWIRNIGRGPAFEVHVLMFPEKIVIDEKEFPLHDDESQCVSFKVIAAGGSVPYDHFKVEMRPTEKSQSMIGKFGLYCVDAEAHELAWTQNFVYTTCLNEDEPFATLEIATPRNYVRATPKPNEKRSLEQITNHFRILLKENAEEDARATTKPADIPRSEAKS